MVKFTRGGGILENFLAVQRAKKADSLIEDRFRSGKILDVGCGAFPLFLFKTRFKDKYGLDYQNHPSLKGMTLKKLDVSSSRIPYRSRTFNVVTMLAVLEHFNQFQGERILLEAKRTLKKGGLIILTTPTPLGNKVLKVMAKIGLVSSEEINEHKKIYALKELKKKLIDFGFQPVSAKHFEFFMNNSISAIKT